MSQARAIGFPPVADERARVLIVGSMPGQASLAAARYYAHPRNAFWPIVTAICGLAATASYERRIAALRRQGVALWDVLHACVRPGSLDADIDEATIVVNDFAAFLAAHPRIGTVLCNGGKAFVSWRRHVQPTLAGRSLAVRQLPSTSPAHAARSFADKLAIWRAALVAAREPEQAVQS